ncbi:hypothetical protein M406DRAFT_296319 [Cryphonectria parasitica EP155]|uniref:AHC1-like C2H2 zinc-finger domain-containing protein n=1 Tax=Cryphonectria parasitica (strain ATCC 38755 / EP155) TaxID=660469 RepID=A0A9P4XTR3_CRYP1|nr:uncharacterized protein M406DRAFT_296319 [Cryphonectria parasitica EP155]KAF3760859.1 hypothetical protein M406DRAFT_296319 [Cryphonectria parasitica EP155]
MSHPQDALSLNTDARSLKRKVSYDDKSRDDLNEDGLKRQRVEYSVATPPETPAAPARKEYFSPPPTVLRQSSGITDRIVDIINQQFGTEILLRHQELRFINQELAKCQAALEQLRRCHLIPYPTTCPTPQQMLDIVDGKVPAVQSKNGGPAPQWAPPYGVVDGPYARHYAKWLIPDPKFDGQVPEWQVVPAASRLVGEGRSTRNSQSEGVTIGKRVARGQVAFKAPVPVATPKTKGPCILKRSDGVTVKLFCHLEKADGKRCDRDDFSSTQGFINHVRITHKKEFKSHDEAAFFCGVPITADESVPARNEEKTTTGAQPTTGQGAGVVHPLARADATTEQNAYARILQRIDTSLKLFHQGKLPGITRIPGVSSQAPSARVDWRSSKSFVASPATPFLSQLLHARNFEGDLRTHVEDAKTREEDVDDIMPGEDESDEGEQGPDTKSDDMASAQAASRVPAMRVPARAVPTASATESGTSSSKGRSPHLSLLPPSGVTAAADEDASSVLENNVMDLDRSPNTATSNNAPSLVSDDGGDDSDDASSSSDASDVDMSDIAEVDIEYIDMQDPLAQHAGSTSNGARKKDEARHVSFVTPVPGKAAARRKPRV